MLGNFYFARKNDQVLLTNDTGQFIFLSPADFICLLREKKIPESEKWQELIDKGFCFENSPEAFARDMENNIRDANGYLFDATSLFIFAVTNECNYRCVYCQANGGRRVEMMREDVAESALNRIAQSPSERITIEFQGGEPLTNFNIVRYIVRRSKEILARRNVQLTLVSNLSLMTDEIAAFLSENRVSVSTSLDGPPFLHDRNRPAASGRSSYEATMRGKQILENHGIFPGAIETTTAYSLLHPEEIVDVYVQNGFGQLFIRPLTRLGAAARAWDTIGYTPKEFLDFYKRALNRILEYNRKGKRLNEYHASLFLSKMMRNRSANYMELRSPCGAGLGQMAITANGNVYTCDEGRMAAEMGDEAFLMGNVFDQDYNQWIESPTCKAVCSASLLETLPGCCDCVYKPYCGVCPVVNYMINGSITRNSTDRCMIYRGILDILFEYMEEGDPETMRIFSEWSEQV